MKISIALATYNGAKWLDQQLESFLAQTTLPDELIVCDDCSSDNTIAIVESFKARAPFLVSLYVNIENLGCSKNFEQALLKSTGDLILISDQDDVWMAEKITVIVAAALNNSQAKLIVNDALYVDEDLNSMGVTVLEKIIKITGDTRAHINGACMAMTKQFRDFVVPFPIENCPMYDLYLHRWADFIDCRLVVRDVLQVWRIHNTNHTQNEMGKSRDISTFKLYLNYKGVNVQAAYLKTLVELVYLQESLSQRKDKFLSANFGKSHKQVLLRVEKRVAALRSRLDLVSMRFIQQKFSIIKMLLTGKYSYFSGFRSFLKDILMW